jgi:hypothetical protein
MANRALKVGDHVTFRGGAPEQLRAVYPWLPTEERWLQSREKVATVRNRGLTLLANGRIRAFVSLACSWDESGMSAWPGQLKLDDRPRRWKFHDKLESEQLDAREKRARRCAKKIV